MTNPEVFYKPGGLVDRRHRSRTDESGAQAAQPMQPNFVLMKLPGEAGAEFVEILPFTPANRNNLIGDRGAQRRETMAPRLSTTFPRPADPTAIAD